MKIRQEEPCDYNAVYQVVTESFLTQNHTEEPDYLNGLRTKSEFIPQLSLVAETEDGIIVGQIALHQTTISYSNSKDIQLTVSPLSVSPSCFGRGVGSALLREGLKIARQMDIKLCFYGATLISIQSLVLYHPTSSTYIIKIFRIGKLTLLWRINFVKTLWTEIKT